MEHFFGFGRRWLRQRVSSGPSSGLWYDPSRDLLTPQVEAEQFQGQGRCRWLFHCWLSIPSPAKLSGFQASYTQRQLEKSFDKLHPGMLANTQHWLCYSQIMFTVKWFRDWGIIQHGPQPNTSRSTKYLMIPDSWNQSPQAEILFNFFFFSLRDKTKLFCSNTAVYKSLIKAIGWFTSGITEVRTIKQGFILQLTHILCYPLSRLSGASAWGEERWGTARSYVGSTRNYWCQGNTVGEMKWCISNSLFFLWKDYDQKNRALGC